MSLKHKILSLFILCSCVFCFCASSDTLDAGKNATLHNNLGINYLKENNSDTGYDQSVVDDFNASLTAEPEKGSGKSGGAEPGEDELLPKAIDIAIDLKQISASFLQRKLGVGYNRAARLIDQMEERGIIGGKDGSNPRQVLMTRADFESQE